MKVRSAGRRLHRGYGVAVLVVLASALTPGTLGLGATGTAAGPPPSMSFGPNVKTPSGNGTNEPQATVDQSGRTFLTWQGDAAPFPGTRVVSTLDGSSFQPASPEYPDPNSGVSVAGGDVVLTTTNWPSHTDTPAPDTTGSNTVFWSDLAPTPTASAGCNGPIQVRAADTTNQEATGNASTDWIDQNAAGCQPSQVDRQWEDAWTPPTYRGTPGAKSHTELFATYHDFGSSAIWLIRSFDGGASWQTSPMPVVAANQALSACNTIPGGLAVDKSGLHPGRVYVTWESSDPPANPATGCNLTQAQPFDHLYLAYSDDAQTCAPGPAPNACAPATWTQANVFDDPCFPPGYPASQACQDISEFFAPVAVDDGGTPYVAYTRRNLADSTPEYDIWLATGTFANGALSFTNGPGAHTHRVDPPASGTHYQAALVAGEAGAVDVAYYGTSFVGGVGALNKPAALPTSALWYVYLSQSFDYGTTFTQNQVSDQSNYYGDVCNTGIFCGNGAPFGWGDDRILFEDFGLAIGPDGGARLDWTDSRLSGCDHNTQPTSCQSGHTNIFFACQTSGLGLHGEAMTGCGQSLPVQTPEVPSIPLMLLLAAGTIATGIGVRRRRLSRKGA